jgi:hypothetical protein
MYVRTSKKYSILILKQEKDLKSIEENTIIIKSIQPLKAVKCDTSTRFSTTENG